MKTDKVSFGTKPLIGDMSAHNGLRKYNVKLTDGIIDAFEKLSKNNVDDKLILKIGQKTGAKKDTTDAIEIYLWVKGDNGNDFHPKSSIVFSPKTLQKFSRKSISELILNTYKKLTLSTRKANANVYSYPLKSLNKISKSHEAKIEDLTDKFGFDDWTCA